MPNSLKFPPSVEIKRAIAAAERAGVEIGSIEIHPRKVIIYAKDPSDEAPKLSAYDIWKQSDEEVARRARAAGGQSDALPKKPRR